MNRFSLDASGAVEVIQREVFDGQGQVHKVTTVEALVRAQCGREVRCAWLLNSRCVALRWLGPLEEQASESAAVPPTTPIIVQPVISAELDSTVTV